MTVGICIRNYQATTAGFEAQQSLLKPGRQLRLMYATHSSRWGRNPVAIIAAGQNSEPTVHRFEAARADREYNNGRCPGLSLETRLSCVYARNFRLIGQLYDMLVPIGICTAVCVRLSELTAPWLQHAWQRQTSVSELVRVSKYDFSAYKTRNLLSVQFSSSPSRLIPQST